jgi:hypothetical protein
VFSSAIRITYRLVQELGKKRRSEHRKDGRRVRKTRWITDMYDKKKREE